MCYLSDVIRLRVRQVHVYIVANRQRYGDVICTVRQLALAESLSRVHHHGVGAYIDQIPHRSYFLLNIIQILHDNCCVDVIMNSLEKLRVSFSSITHCFSSLN